SPTKRRLQLSGVNKKRLSTDHLNNRTENISSEEASDMKINDYSEKFTIGDISDLFELCKAQCPPKYLSVLLYMSLRHFNITWHDCDVFLHDVGSLKARTVHN
ncbi:unnamed protein product, partial [Adineta steineri]